MTVETDFRDVVVADAGVSAIVGTRVWPQKALDTWNETDEAIVYRVISQNPTNGKLCFRTRIQADLYAESYSDLKALRDAFVTMVHGQSNWRPSIGPDLHLDVGSKRVYHVPVDVMIEHMQS